MPDSHDIDYDARRAALIEKYKPLNQPAGAAPVQTGGVDHLALICSDVGHTIEFYTEVVGMTLNKAMDESPELKEFVDANEEVGEIMDMAYKLEGIVRNVGRHAGGARMVSSRF